MDKKENVTREDLKNVYDSGEKIALQIRMLSRAVKKMSESGLRKDTIVLLLHDSSGVGKPDIRAVLESMDNLERDYLKPLVVEKK
jgi:hypothetical protein